jgi:predicted TIM-barrel fold metal-dependent hydrolase
VIIDGHCHAGPGDGFTGPWDTDAPLDRYLERADRAGIEHTVIFPAFHSDYAAANEKVAEIVARNPARFSGLAFVHAVRDRGRVLALVSRAVRVHRFRGIKCHRYDARITREICDAARALGVPILYDVMGEVESVELFAPQYRDVTFIIPHLGSFADDWRAQHTFIDTLVRHENVVTDTSGIRRFDLLEEAVRRAGPHKVIFGSDGPWLHPGLELAKTRALGLGPEAKALIQSGNAMRVFRLGHLSIGRAGQEYRPAVV